MIAVAHRTTIAYSDFVGMIRGFDLELRDILLTHVLAGAQHEGPGGILDRRTGKSVRGVVCRLESRPSVLSQ